MDCSENITVGGGVEAFRFLLGKSVQITHREVQLGVYKNTEKAGYHYLFTFYGNKTESPFVSRFLSGSRRESKSIRDMCWQTG